MVLLHEEYESFLDPSRAVLKVYGPPAGPFLVTEERRGTTTVVATLGAFDTRDAALARARARGRELEARRYTRVSPAA
jgi:hypothetical protein